jgi:gentisate 1,2-dioxygenase
MLEATMTTTTSNPNAALDAVIEAAKKQSAVPLWPVLGTLSTPEPRPKAVPHVWPFAVMRPFCEAAAKLVGTEFAERRVFSLINPALGDPYTTDTLYAGLQTILPGETARAHRHSPFALRFIIEGERGFTAVEGEKVMMERGDMVLTPSWEWHDHGNEGDRPMIWLDGLDLPLWQVLPSNFTEHYAEARYPSELLKTASNRKYPWAEMQPKLDAQPGLFAEERYAMREGGADISKTIGASAYRIDAGASTNPLRETASAVMHVYEGSGRTTVGDTVLTWKQGDSFALPAWQKIVHENTGASTAYLFRFDDRPLMTALAALRQDEG